MDAPTEKVRLFCKEWKGRYGADWIRSAATVELTVQDVLEICTALDAANARADAAEEALSEAMSELAATKQAIRDHNALMQRITDAGNYVHPDRLKMAKEPRT